MELASFGFYYSKHPVSLLRKTLSSRIQPINKLITTTNEKFIPALINHKRIVKKGASIFVFLEVSDETGIIDVSVPIELHDEKKPLFKENGVVMIKGTVVADDFRKGNFEDVGIKIRATDVMPIELARSTVTSSIRLDVSRTQLKELGNGKFEELKALNDPNGINVVFYLKDDDLNISSEVKVDSFKVSLEDSTFEKINEIFGEENYKLF
jgi:DNA polymerase III alpha subunit